MKKSYVLLSLFPVFAVLAWQARTVSSTLPTDADQIVASAPATEKAEQQEEADFLELSERLEDGEKESSEMNEEWLQWVGQENPVHWSKLNIKKAHRLAMIISDYQNLADRPFRIMHIHSIGYDGEADDSATYYTNEIDGMDEKLFRMDFVISRSIEPTGDKFMLSEAERNMYQLRLSRQTIKQVFHGRAPQMRTGNYYHEIHDNDLDIVRTLIQGDSGLAEGGLYQREIQWNDQVYQVQLNLRETSLETITIEVQIQTDGLTIQRFALIYEAI